MLHCHECGYEFDCPHCYGVPAESVTLEEAKAAFNALVPVLAQREQYLLEMLHECQSSSSNHESERSRR